MATVALASPALPRRRSPLWFVKRRLRGHQFDTFLRRRPVLSVLNPPLVLVQYFVAGRPVDGGK